MFFVEKDHNMIDFKETAKFDQIDKAARSLVYLTAYHPKSDMTDFEEKRIQFNRTRPKGQSLRQK